MGDRESIVELPGKLVTVNNQKYNSGNVLGLYFHQSHDLTNLTVKEIIENVICKNSAVLQTRVESYELQVINVESRNKVSMNVCLFNCCFLFVFKT